MRKIFALGVMATTIAMFGCGGGGGGGTSLGTSSGTGRAAVVITDGFREQYTHVWATIFHVEAIPQGGGANVVLFDNATGVSVDLRTLHDSGGSLFSFVGSAGVPVGSYTGLQVTIGPIMQLFLNGATTATTYNVDSSIPTNGSGDPLLTETFLHPKTVSATATASVVDMIIDFNLDNFVLRGSKVIPFIQDNAGTGVTEPARQCPSQYVGTVSSLAGTSPALTFTLTSPSGSTQTVVTTATTSLYGDTLANGSVVYVTGTLDSTSGNLVATRVEVAPTTAPLPGPGPGKLQLAAGAATVADATAGTFTLTVSRSLGFTPATTTITVATTSTTVFRGDNGAKLAAADFFTALATSANVELCGTYDATSNTLTATSIAIDNPSMDLGFENGPHNFRPGSNAGNWGNDAEHPGGH